MVWFLYFPLAVLSYIVCLITNPIVILFCDENGELHGFWHLWQTWDDSCDAEYFMDNVCPKFLDYDYHKHYTKSYGKIELNRERIYSTWNGTPFTLVERIQRYFCRLWWLTRNCAYGFAYQFLSKDVRGTDVQIKYKDEYTMFGYDPDSGAWILTSEQPIIPGFFRWEVFLGWKIAMGSTEKTTAMIAIRAVFRFE